MPLHHCQKLLIRLLITLTASLSQSPHGRDIPLPPRDAVIKWHSRDSDGNYVVPYSVTGLFHHYEIETLEQAMLHIEANTCIRFRARRSERFYAEIRNVKGLGCTSGVGARANGDLSVVNLESPSQYECTKYRNVVHELLHLIGLNHEHERYGAHKHIIVHYENIRPGIILIIIRY